MSQSDKEAGYFIQNLKTGLLKVMSEPSEGVSRNSAGSGEGFERLWQ